MVKIAMNETGASSAKVVPDGLTLYTMLAGPPSFQTTENRVETRIYDTLTLANLFIRVTSNAATSASTIKSRVNAADGNQSITLGAGLTGTFEDTTNTDSLSNGDDAGVELANGGGGNIAISVVSSTISHASSMTSLLGHPGETINASGTFYMPLAGEGNRDTTESLSQYIIRFAGTWSRLAVRAHANTRARDTDVISRIGGADGNITITVPANTTGLFEDTSNSDALSAADVINYRVTTNAGGPGGSISISYIESRLVTSSTDSQIMMAADATNDFLTPGLTRYMPSYGDPAPGATESNVLLEIRGATFDAQNFFVRIEANTLDGSSSYKSRINEADGNLVITVGAAASGAFEDTTNSDSYVDADEIDYEVVSGGSSGSLEQTIVAMEMLFTGAIVAAGGQRSGVWRIPNVPRRRNIEEERMEELFV